MSGFSRSIGSALARLLSVTGGAGLVGTVDPLEATVERALARRPSRAGRASAGDLPRFMATIRGYRHDLQAQIPIIGVGSSVGAGAALAAPLTDAPVAHFASQLRAVFDPAGLYNFSVSNQSVGGTVATDFATAWAATLALGYTTPGIVVFAYGMNDQAPSAFNSGQTFPGFISAMRAAINTVRAAGWDAVILTSPHASVTRFPNETLTLNPAINQGYPTAIVAPVSNAALQPSLANGAVTADLCGDGVSITVSHRALRVNQAMRSLAREFGVALVDAERYWFEALQKFKLSTGTMAGAEGSLYAAGEYVHPNLTGHQLSYHRAIDDFMKGFACQAGQAGVEPRGAWRLGVNADAPAASLEVLPAYGETAPALRVSAATGQADGNGVRIASKVFEVEQSTGDLLLYRGVTNSNNAAPVEAWRLHARLDASGTVVAGVDEVRSFFGGQVFKDRHDVAYNVPIGAQSPPALTLPANSWGTLTVDGYQNGIGRQRTVVEWVTTAGAVTFGAARTVQTGGAVFTGPTAAGLTPQVTNAAAGTNLAWRIESRT